MPGNPKNLTLCPYPCCEPSTHMGAPLRLQTPTPALPTAQPQADGQRWRSQSRHLPCSFLRGGPHAAQPVPVTTGSPGAPLGAALPLPRLLEAPRSPSPQLAWVQRLPVASPTTGPAVDTGSPRWRLPVRDGVRRRGRKESSGISLSLGHALQGLMLTWLRPSPALACSPGCCSRGLVA